MAKLTVAQIKELREDLAKASSESRTSDIKAILAKLKAGVEPSEDVIRATKIGQTIGSLRKSNDKSVAELAKELVQSWKAQVDKQRSQTGTASAAGSSAKKENGGASSSQGNGEKKSESALKPSAPVKLDFSCLGDKTRDASLKAIYTSLNVGNSSDSAEAYDRALDVEAAAYERFVGSSGEPNAEYRGKMRSLMLNLKDKNNPSLRESVLGGTVSGQRLVDMKPDEMASDKMKKELEELRQKNLFNAKGAEPQQGETDAFQCGRCKQRKVYYRQQQTRSADEPMTTFCTCSVCGNRWKFC